MVPVTRRFGLGPTLAGALLVGALGELRIPLAGWAALVATAVLALGEVLAFLWVVLSPVRLLRALPEDASPSASPPRRIRRRSVKQPPVRRAIGPEGEVTPSAGRRWPVYEL